MSLVRKLGYNTTANNKSELNCINPAYDAGCARFHLLTEKHSNKVIFIALEKVKAKAVLFEV